VVEKVKVFFLVSNDLLTDQRMHRICETLATLQNYEIHLIGRKLFDNELPAYLFKAKRLNCFFKNGKLFYIELFLKQFLYCIKHAPDIICSNDADTLLAAHFYAKRKKKKHLHDAHELFSQVPEIKDKKTTQKIWQFIEKIGFRTVSRCYTVSEPIANYYQKYFEQKVLLLKNYPRKKKYQIESEKTYDVLYQGAINQGRGLEILIDASIASAFSLAIVGEGDLTNWLKERIANTAHIAYFGRILPSALDEITPKARIGYNVLDNSSKSYNFALPNKTFDYMQFGLPQIIGNTEELRLLNKKLTFAIEVNYNAIEVQNAVKMLLSNQDIYNLLAKNALQLSENYCWENEEGKLIEIYTT